MAKPVTVIPPAIRRDINVHSGYLGPKSRYYDMELKALFKCPVNIEYLGNELCMLLAHPAFIKDNLGEGDRTPAKARRLMLEFVKGRGKIRNMMQEMVEGYKLPFPEDFSIMNPVAQLAQVNLEFLKEMGAAIVMSPQMICSFADRIDPDTGIVAYADADYDASSYAGGTWKPEDLFLNTAENRGTSVWSPVEVNFVSGPDAERGPGHRYQGDVYHGSRAGASLKAQTYDSQTRPDRRSINRDGVQPASGPQKYQNEQFPRWQAAGANRPYERSTVYNQQTMNGDQERRVLGTGSYDMSRLMARPSY